MKVGEGPPLEQNFFASGRCPLSENIDDHLGVLGAVLKTHPRVPFPLEQRVRTDQAVQV